MLKRRPKENEFAPYYGGYIAKTEGEDVIQLLKDYKESTTAFLQSLPLEKWDYAYAEGKWTIKEVILHIIDTERVFAYRSMRIARGDKTALPGFDQDLYVAGSNAAERSAGSLIAEYMATREATIFFFENLTDEASIEKGTASGVVFTPHGTAFITAGHENHHIQIIKERYL